MAKRVWLGLLLGLSALVLGACAYTLAASSSSTTDKTGVISGRASSTSSPSGDEEVREAMPIPEPTGTPTAASVPTTTVLPSTPTVELVPEEMPPSRADTEFATDFSRHTVPYSEILSGGPSKDVIPAVDKPEVVSVLEADA